jgi:hypothetical protein
MVPHHPCPYCKWIQLDSISWQSVTQTLNIWSVYPRFCVLLNSCTNCVVIPPTGNNCHWTSKSVICNRTCILLFYINFVFLHNKWQYLNKKFWGRIKHLFSFDMTWTTKKMMHPKILLLLHVSIVVVKFLPSCCLAMTRGYTYRHRQMGEIHEVCCWDGLRCHELHTQFHKDWFRHLKVDSGRFTDTQTAWWSHKPNFSFSI